MKYVGFGILIWDIFPSELTCGFLFEHVIFDFHEIKKVGEGSIGAFPASAPPVEILTFNLLNFPFTTSRLRDTIDPEHHKVGTYPCCSSPVNWLQAKRSSCISLSSS